MPRELIQRYGEQIGPLTDPMAIAKAIEALLFRAESRRRCDEVRLGKPVTVEATNTAVERAPAPPYAVTIRVEFHTRYYDAYDGYVNDEGAFVYYEDVWKDAAHSTPLADMRAVVQDMRDVSAPFGEEPK